MLAGFTLLPTPLKPLPATFRPGPGLLHNTDPGDTPSPSRPGYQPPCPRDQQHRSSPHLEPQRWPSPLPEPTSPPRLPEAPSKFTPQPSLVSPRQQGRRGNIQLLKWSQAHAHVEDGTRGVRATSPGRGSGVEGGRCGPSTTSEGWALGTKERKKRKKEGKGSPSVVSNSATPWTIAYQGPLSMGFPRQEYWSRLPFPSPGDLPNPGIKPGSPVLRADTLPSEPP